MTPTGKRKLSQRAALVRRHLEEEDEVAKEEEEGGNCPRPQSTAVRGYAMELLLD